MNLFSTFCQSLKTKFFEWNFCTSQVYFTLTNSKVIILATSIQTLRSSGKCSKIFWATRCWAKPPKEAFLFAMPGEMSQIWSVQSVRAGWTSTEADSSPLYGSSFFPFWSHFQLCWGSNPNVRGTQCENQIAGVCELSWYLREIWAGDACALWTKHCKITSAFLYHGSAPNYMVLYQLRGEPLPVSMRVWKVCFY